VLLSLASIAGARSRRRARGRARAVGVNESRVRPGAAGWCERASVQPEVAKTRTGYGLQVLELSCRENSNGARARRTWGRWCRRWRKGPGRAGRQRRESHLELPGPVRFHERRSYHSAISGWDCETAGAPGLALYGRGVVLQDTECHTRARSLRVRAPSTSRPCYAVRGLALGWTIVLRRRRLAGCRGLGNGHASFVGPKCTAKPRAR
jgi:hypothetical protein